MRYLLFHKGTVETLEYFSKCIAKELVRAGREVLLFEINDNTMHLEELCSYLKGGDVTLITFNFHGIQNEAIFYDARRQLFWDKYSVQCVNIVVDHPLYYYKELKDLPEHYLQFCIDYGHEAYMRRYYPQVALGKTMPLAGSFAGEVPEELCRALEPGHGGRQGRDMSVLQRRGSEPGMPALQRRESEPGMSVLQRRGSEPGMSVLQRRGSEPGMPALQRCEPESGISVLQRRGSEPGMSVLQRRGSEPGMPALQRRGSEPGMSVLQRCEPESGILHGREPVVPRPIAARSMEVAFTGNYTPPQNFECYITRLDEEYERFYRGMLDDLFEHPEREIDEVFTEHICREMGGLPDEEMLLAHHNLMFLDMYVRFSFRGSLIRLLTENGIVVHAFGAGWDLLDTRRKDCLVCHGSQISLQCLETLADTKLSLNVMPWFKRGAHDRIYNSMRSGAVSVTDTSQYLKETLTDGETAVFYELRELDVLRDGRRDLENPVLFSDAVSPAGHNIWPDMQLSDRIRELLADTDRMQRIADAGYAYVTRYHTWELYTAELIKQAEAVK